MTAAEALEAEVDLTVRQVAQLTSLSQDAIYRAVERRELDAYRLCDRIRIEPDAYRRWKAARRVKPRRTGSSMLEVPSERRGSFRSRLGQIERGERAR